MATKTARTARFKVTMEVPAEMTMVQARDYIQNAVEGWRGQFFPGSMDHDPDPEWLINRKKIKVARMTRATR